MIIFEVEKYMQLVDEAISRYIEKGAAWTDIYNRAYEAVLSAIRDKDVEIGRITVLRDAALNSLRALKEASRWIPVSERLPDDDTPILATSGNSVVIGYGSWLYRNPEGELRMPARFGRGMSVTHWYSLPEAPESEV